MKVFKIDVTSWTASFRYPNLISGTQPTLEVPPLSTVLGLINAAAGRYLQHSHLQLGYYFEYESEGEDIETIYQISSIDGKPSSHAMPNIIKRKFLVNNFLRIYTPDEEIAEYLSAPYFQILLGRVNDLATITKISPKEHLEKIENASEIRGQIIPFKHHLPGQIQALPQYFTNEFPRQNLGTEPYSVISFKARNMATNLPAFRDKLPNTKEVDIYFHDMKF